MKFGHFDDVKKEYVISNPRTPYPWINYLGTQEFFSLISNTAGGYSFYKDARLRRITRYRYNNVPHAPLVLPEVLRSSELSEERLITSVE